MITLKIIGIWETNIKNIETWQPKNHKDVYLGIELAIGVAGKEGSDTYGCTVATAQGLAREEFDNDVAFLRHVILIKRFDWPSIKRLFEKTVKMCESSTYLESASKLNCYFDWEYEDHI